MEFVHNVHFPTSLIVKTRNASQSVHYTKFTTMKYAIVSIVTTESMVSAHNAHMAQSILQVSVSAFVKPIKFILMEYAFAMKGSTESIKYAANVLKVLSSIKYWENALHHVSITTKYTMSKRTHAHVKLTFIVQMESV